jgi:hypothetical protein
VRLTAGEVEALAQILQPMLVHGDAEARDHADA